MIATVLFLVVTSAMLGICLASTRSQAEAKIKETEDSMNSVYTEALKAEESGANVSNLLVKLDSAGKLHAMAHMLYRNGDLNGTIHYSDLATQNLKGLTEEAQQMRDSAALRNKARFREAMTISSLASVGIVAGGIIGWRALESHHPKKASKQRDEVLEK